MMFSTLYNKNYKIFEISFTLQQINIIKFNLLMKIIYIDFFISLTIFIVNKPKWSVIPNFGIF